MVHIGTTLPRTADRCPFIQGGLMDETIDAVVDRIYRCGDRYRACGDRDGEEKSNAAAQAASVAATPEAARSIEIDLYRSLGIATGKPSRPTRLMLQIAPPIRPTSFVTGGTIQSPWSLTDGGDLGLGGGDFGGGDGLGGDGNGNVGNGNGAEDHDDGTGLSVTDDS
jgi:hypothetical protein